MEFHKLRTVMALALLATLSCIVRAQEPVKQQPAAKPRQTRPATRTPAEEPQKTEPETVEQSPEQLLGLKMDDLSRQIQRLTSELQLLRKQTEHNGAATELMLYEERLSKVESKLDDLTSLKNQLEARDQEIQRRMRNIQAEIVLRGGSFLRRDEAEAAVRGDLQRALEDTRAQKESTNQRITDLQGQADHLRRRIEVLRKKLEQLENRVENQNQ